MAVLNWPRKIQNNASPPAPGQEQLISLGLCYFDDSVLNTQLFLFIMTSNISLFEILSLLISIGALITAIHATKIAKTAQKNSLIIAMSNNHQKYHDDIFALNSELETVTSTLNTSAADAISNISTCFDCYPKKSDRWLNHLFFDLCEHFHNEFKQQLGWQGGRYLHYNYYLNLRNLENTSNPPKLLTMLLEAIPKDQQIDLFFKIRNGLNEYWKTFDEITPTLKKVCEKCSELLKKGEIDPDFPLKYSPLYQRIQRVNSSSETILEMGLRTIRTLETPPIAHPFSQLVYIGTVLTSVQSSGIWSRYPQD